MSTQAFSPQLLPQSLAVTAAAQSIAWNTLVPLIGPQSQVGRFANMGTQVIYWLQDLVNTITVANGTPMAANSIETFTLKPGVPVQVIAPATGSTLTISMGEGV